MRFLRFAIAMLLLVAGCGYFDNPAADSTPVALPADANWELIATLQHNPLDPARFYIFPEESVAMNNAYEAGKHFIFEFSGEYKEDNTRKTRHYIIQPEPPFQDKDKNPYQLLEEEEDGVKWHIHEYFFRSEGWYEPVEFVGNYGSIDEAIGFCVEFATTHIEPSRGGFTSEDTLYRTEIGLVNEPFGIVGRGDSYIKHDTRLRIYVSR